MTRPEEVSETPRFVERQLDRSRVEWIVGQVSGDHVAVLGSFDALMLATLGKSTSDLMLYASDTTEARRASENLPSTCRPEIEELRASTVETPDGYESRADTVIVEGWPKGFEPAIALRHMRRVGKPEGRLVIVLTEFAAERHRQRGFDFTSMLDALRLHVVPEHLVIENEELRFVGRFGKPNPSTWRRFEEEVWPDAVGAMVQSMQARHRAELAGLGRRLRDFQGLTETTSFRLGLALVRALKSPRGILGLPVQLARIYRSARLRRPKLKFTGPIVTLPALQAPPPETTDLPVVAAILDTFSEHAFRYEAELLLVTPESWRREMDKTKPSFLLVESAWVGNGGDWRGLVSSNERLRRSPLVDLLAYCRGHNIPTVFWNKEDPPHFDAFIDTAKRFDVVFTTDADCVPRYVAACGHNRVHTLPFAAQPMLHNPRRDPGWPRYKVAFAGSWSENHHQRTASVGPLLDAAQPFGLHIFDRNLRRKDLGWTERFRRFPRRYHRAIRGSLDYDRMLTAYRCYDVLLNTNSVAESPTMFSRRVFESLACGTPVVSTKSVGMRELLGRHVRVAADRQGATAHLKSLLDDEEARVREGHLAYRFVHEHHTYRHRMDDIRRAVGLAARDATRHSVTVVAVAAYQSQAIRAMDNFTLQDYPDRDLLLILHGTAFDEDTLAERTSAISNIRLISMERAETLAGCLNHAVDQASGDYVAMIDADCVYGEHYLADTMLAARYSDAEVIGKGTYYLYSEDDGALTLEVARPEHQLTDFVVGSTLIVRRELLSNYGFNEKLADPATAFVRDAAKAGRKIYSADRFNHVAVKPKTNVASRHVEGDRDEYWSARPGLDLSRALL